jgi:hypothetical protein
MNDLTDLELQVIEINDRLRPISTRPVDINDPNWTTLLSQEQHPLDEAGVRSAAETLLDTPGHMTVPLNISTVERTRLRVSLTSRAW